MPSSDSTDFITQLSDGELVVMLNTMRDLFPEEIIQAILIELENRKLPPEKLAKLKRETENNRLKAPQPMGIFWKLIALLVPFFTIIFPTIIRAQGYHRKARELNNWSLYGLFAYTILVVLVGLLSM